MLKRVIFAVGIACMMIFYQGCGGSDAGHDVIPQGSDDTIVLPVVNTQFSLLGMGYDAIGNKLHATDCVDGTLSAPAGPFTTSYNVTIHQTIEDLEKTMNLAAGASVNYGMYSGGGSFEMMDSISKTSNNTYLYMSIDILGPTMLLKNPALSSAMASKSKVKDVLDLCGDHYAQQITSGAQFVVVFAMQNVDSSTATDIKTKVDAAANDVSEGGKVSASHSSALKSAVSENNVQVTSWITGCKAQIVGTDIDTILNSADEFVKSVNEGCAIDPNANYNNTTIMRLAKNVSFYSMKDVIDDHFGTGQFDAAKPKTQSNVNALLNLAEKNAAFLADIDFMLNNQSLFDFGGNGSSTLEHIQYLKQQACAYYAAQGSNCDSASGGFLNGFLNGCEDDPYSCGNPTVIIEGDGSGAAAIATATSGVITGITVTNGGRGYPGGTAVNIYGDGSGATATANVEGGVVKSITVTNGGSGYTEEGTSVNIQGEGGSGATAEISVVNGLITDVAVTNGGSGYTRANISFENVGSGATATATVTSGAVTAITVTNKGVGYTPWYDIPAETAKFPHTYIWKLNVSNVDYDVYLCVNGDEKEHKTKQGIDWDFTEYFNGNSDVQISLTLGHGPWPCSDSVSVDYKLYRKPELADGSGQWEEVWRRDFSNKPTQTCGWQDQIVHRVHRNGRLNINIVSEKYEGTLWNKGDSAKCATE